MTKAVQMTIIRNVFAHIPPCNLRDIKVHHIHDPDGDELHVCVAVCLREHGWPETATGAA